MKTNTPKLPIGIQTFSEIRENGFIYVDKTEFLVDLIDTGKIYFLARPRRFGKSLTISTFEAMFTGRKELFTGLYAEEFMNRSDYYSSPVIRLDMSRVTTNRGIDILEKSINMRMTEIAKKYEIAIPDNYPPADSFDFLIRAMNEKYGKVVILLDEYDKPYTEFFDNHQTAEEVRKSLRNLYVRIKANDESIRFVFITGISKFAKFGVFSGLNTPEDISMDETYGEICGLTEDEVTTNFSNYLEKTAKIKQISKKELLEKMRYYYNGFCFDGEHKLYNPFSTLLFLKKQAFDNFWMDSGTPEIIAKYLRDKNLTVEQFRNLPVSREFLRTPGDMDMTTPYGFLYQGGYLTIKSGASDDYNLDYPNTEVLYSMSRLLLRNITNNQYNDYRSILLVSLTNNDKDLFVESINSLLASIPYDDFTGAANQSIKYNGYKYKTQEWLYRSTILAFMRGCGVAVVAEMHTNLGRPDLVITHRGNTYVIELKVADNAEDVPVKLAEAVKQMTENNYAAPYPNAQCLALVIDDTQRQITAMKSAE